jgi:hypothetical protein
VKLPYQSCGRITASADPGTCPDLPGIHSKVLVLQCWYKVVQCAVHSPPLIMTATASQQSMLKLWWCWCCFQDVLDGCPPAPGDELPPSDLPDLRQGLQLLRRLTAQLHSQRLADGALELESAELRFKVRERRVGG